MKRTIIATFEENNTKYARVKDTYWYMSEYYTAWFDRSTDYYKRLDDGTKLYNVIDAVKAYEITKQLGDKFESKTVRKILR